MEKENKPATRRLVSLDALRGFDMFWIMGGEYMKLLSKAGAWWIIPRT